MINFRTLQSSSKGNSVAVWTDQTCLLFDLGLGSMKRTRAAINEAVGSLEKVDGVVVSHIHTDHISFYPLRVVEACGYDLYVYHNCVDALKAKHFKSYGFASLKMNPFDMKPFKVGDLEVSPFRVEHHPSMDTFGFVVRYGSGGESIKFVLATDFCNADVCVDKFVDADFIYIESNHDLELLRKYFNPNSLYHMNNPSTAKMLCDIQRSSSKSPRAVMLGHLSEQRNEPEIAFRETKDAFARAGLEMDFELLVAPPRKCSEVVSVKL